MKKSAFSLLEILLVLAIVGVVAVLVLPTFMKNVSNEVNATVVKSTFADVTKAFQQAMLDQGVRSVSDMEISEASFLKKYFDVSNSCGSSMSPCFAGSYKTIAGKGAKDPGCNAVATISNGASICVTFASGNNVVFVDANGAKSPNIVGRDRFAFSFDDKGQYKPEYTSGDNNYVITKSIDLCAEGYDVGCFKLLATSDWDVDTYSNYLNNVKVKKEKTEKKAAKKKA